MTKLRVLVAEDHPLLRRLIKDCLFQEPRVELIGEAENGPDTVEKARRLNPDVIIMDVSLSATGGLEVTKMIKDEMPRVKVILLLEDDAELYREAALRSGVAECVVKTSLGKDLPSVVASLV